VFTAPELARLEIYRAAAQAGFYNEGMVTARKRRRAMPQKGAYGQVSDLLLS
jgi:hypothetical protein